MRKRYRVSQKKAMSGVFHKSDACVIFSSSGD